MDTTVDEAEDERGSVPESEEDSASGGETGAASREMVAPDITEDLNGGDPGAVSEPIAGVLASLSDDPEDGATIEYGRDLGGSEDSANGDEQRMSRQTHTHHCSTFLEGGEAPPAVSGFALIGWLMIVRRRI